MADRASPQESPTGSTSLGISQPLWRELDAMDISSLTSAWKEVRGVYFLETGIGVPLFDFVAGVREGGFETRIYDFMSPDLELKLYELKDR